MRVLNFRYLFYPFILFLFGIISARYIFGGNVTIIILAVISFTALFLVLNFKGKYKLSIALFLCFLFGVGWFFVGQASYKIKDYDKEVAVVGRVCDNFSEDKNKYYIQLDNVRINGEKSKNISLYLYKNDESKVEIGDKLSFNCNLEKISLFTLNKFNSQYYRNNIGYTTTASTNKVVILEGKRYFDENLRITVKNQLYKNMGQENGAIAYAVLFGDKSGIDDDTITSFRDSGVIHILTVSGLHVGFLISCVYGFLKLCKVNKFVNFGLTIFFIILLALLCGFTPSVVRAGLMGIIVLLSKLTRRRYDTLNSLGLAGFLICLFSPLTALDIGFLMSIACVIGIVFLYPFFLKLLEKLLPYKIGNLLSVSISAQLAIFPFLAVFNSTFNFLSCIANLFILPLFSVLYPYLFIIAILSSFMPFMGVLLNVASWGFIAIKYIALFFSSTSLKIELSEIYIPIVLLIYNIFLLCSQFLMIKTIKKFILFAIAILLMSCSLLISNLPQKSEISLAYLSSHGEESFVLTNKNSERLVIGDNYLLSRYFTSNKIKRGDYYLSMSKIGDRNIDSLSKYNFNSYYCLEGDESNDALQIVELNELKVCGNYKFSYISKDNIFLGISIYLDDYRIFIAKENNIDYNDLYINYFENFKPHFIYCTDKNYLIGEGYDSISYSKNDIGSISHSENGNIKLLFSGQNYKLKRID